MAGRATRFKSVCSIHTAVSVTNGRSKAYRITLAGVSEIVSPHKTSENKNAVISGVLFRPKVTGVRIAVPIMAIISQAKYKVQLAMHHIHLDSHHFPRDVRRKTC